MSAAGTASRTHREYRGPVFVADGPPGASLGEGYHASVERLVERCLLSGRALPADEDIHPCEILGVPSPSARDVLAGALRDHEAPEELADNADGRRVEALQSFLDDWFETCGVTFWRAQEGACVVLLPDLRDYVSSVLASRAGGGPSQAYDLRPFFPPAADESARTADRERAGFYAHVDLLGRRDLGVCFVREVRRAGADMWLIRGAGGATSLQCGTGVFRMELLDPEEGRRRMEEAEAAVREAAESSRRARTVRSMGVHEHDVEVVDFGDLVTARLTAAAGVRFDELGGIFLRLVGRDGVLRVASALPHVAPEDVTAHDSLSVNLRSLGSPPSPETARALGAALAALGFRSVTVRQPTPEEHASYNDIPF